MPGRNATPTPWLCALATSVLLTDAARARGDDSDLCLQAAADAAAQTGVPFEVLQAIATVETGRQGRPWPWTVNFGGEGQWFDSADEAEESAQSAIGGGATNVDVGCFQLNYRWHADGFESIAAMLDPDRNATYAANYLAAQFARTGDWALAAAAYHSATPEYAAAYQSKFEKVYAGLSGDTPPPPVLQSDEPGRENSFPLLIAGATGSRGSLVPSGSRGLRLIGGP